MIERSFGLDVVEKRECTGCGYSMPEQNHLAFFHYVPPARLLEVQREAGESGERPTPEELLLRAYNVDTRPCPNCSNGKDVRFRCTSTLSQAPSVFSLVSVWTNAEAAAEVSTMCVWGGWIGHRVTEAADGGGVSVQMET